MTATVIGARITEKGEKALRDDSALKPKHRLVLEIMKAVGKPLPLDTLIAVTNQVLADCGGDVDKAIMGIKLREIVVTWEPHQ